MSAAVWHFVTYSCGHSTPVRGYDRTIPEPCSTCKGLAPHDYD